MEYPISDFLDRPHLWRNVLLTRFEANIITLISEWAAVSNFCLTEVVVNSFDRRTKIFEKILQVIF